MDVQETLLLIRGNLLSPIVLAFFFGVFARLVKSDLKFPEPIYTAMSVYFLFAVGLRGGVELGQASWSGMLMPIVIAMLVGAIIPVLCGRTLTRRGEFSPMFAAAMASHHGFLSTVSVFAALEWLAGLDIPAARWLPALVGFMELTSLGVSLLMMRERAKFDGFFGQLAEEVLNGKSILLIVGGTIIGLCCGMPSWKGVEPFFEEPFRGVTCLLMIHLGLMAGERLADLRRSDARQTILLGLATPIVFATIGIVLAHLIGLSVGERMVLGVLAAGSAYLVAAIAVHTTFPRLDFDRQYGASLAVALPFNLTFGFPLYLALAEYL